MKSPMACPSPLKNKDELTPLFFPREGQGRNVTRKQKTKVMPAIPPILVCAEVRQEVVRAGKGQTRTPEEDFWFLSSLLAKTCK